MVLGFVIQTISSDSDTIPSVCYWEPFGFIAKKYNNDVTLTNKREKDCLSYILSRVQTEFIFRKEVDVKQDCEDSPRVKNEHGIFRIIGHDFLSDECHVIWRTILGSAFMFILSPTENVPLAEINLQHIIGFITDLFNMSEDGVQQLLTYPEKVAVVTHIFLPAGQLIVMNHKVVRQFQKDLENILAEKV